jgi:hypothetical protein
MNCTVCTPLSSTQASPLDSAHKLPGHWLLAKLGKRVLRPGGLELTRGMLERLNIQPRDAVVEFAQTPPAPGRDQFHRHQAMTTYRIRTTVPIHDPTLTGHPRGADDASAANIPLRGTNRCVICCLTKGTQ